MRHTMTWAVAAGLLLSGCAMEGATEEDVGATGEDLTLAHYWNDTTLTLYSEAGFWGDRLTVTLAADGPEETIRLITKTQIEDANLLRRISSLRLRCGNRHGQVMLSQAYNTSTSIGGWTKYASGHPIWCEPGQTVEVNLHAEASEYADRVGSVYFVRHARDQWQSPLSFDIGRAWEQQTEDLDGAEADGPPDLWLVGNKAFRLRQNLRIDHWACTERGGHLELRAILRSDRSWLVTVVSTYVDYGFGDRWGCHSDMQDALDDAAYEAAQDLREGLTDYVAFQHDADDPRLYFVPIFGLRTFNLVSGGQEPPPLVFERAYSF